MGNSLKSKTSYGAISLTLGIITILFSMFWYISLPAGITSIITGRRGDKQYGLTTAKAGVICSSIGLVFTVMALVAYIILIVVNAIEYIY